MKLYADASVRRSLQMLGDLLILGWVCLWVRTAVVVHDATMALGKPGEQLSDAGSGLASQLRASGEAVGGLPVVGEEVRAPFAGAGGAAEQMAAAGDAQVEAVHTLAFWLGLAVGAIPVLIALGVYLPMRWRFVRQATAARRFVDGAADPSTGSGHHFDLFALRAIARQPVHRLARISDDPVAAWRRGEPEVIRELAALELGKSGLSVPVVPVSADNPSA